MGGFKTSLPEKCQELIEIDFGINFIAENDNKLVLVTNNVKINLWKTGSINIQGKNPTQIQLRIAELVKWGEYTSQLDTSTSKVSMSVKLLNYIKTLNLREGIQRCSAAILIDTVTELLLKALITENVGQMDFSNKNINDLFAILHDNLIDCPFEDTIKTYRKEIRNEIIHSGRVPLLEPVKAFINKIEAFFWIF